MTEWIRELARMQNLFQFRRLFKCRPKGGRRVDIHSVTLLVELFIRILQASHAIS